MIGDYSLNDVESDFERSKMMTWLSSNPLKLQSEAFMEYFEGSFVKVW